MIPVLSLALTQGGHEGGRVLPPVLGKGSGRDMAPCLKARPGDKDARGCLPVHFMFLPSSGLEHLNLTSLQIQVAMGQQFALQYIWWRGATLQGARHHHGGGGE